VFVHLFSRRPARTEAFPSLRFLAASPLAPTRRTRLSDWPLLLLRLFTLTLAVAALAQPFRASVRETDGATGTTIDVTDDSPDLTAGIAQAVARLRTQRAPRTVRVRSSFPAGTLDTMWLARVPRDITLAFTTVRARAVVPVPRDTIAWRTALPAPDALAVREAVALLGGSPVRVVGDADASPARITVVTDPRTPGDQRDPDRALTPGSSEIALGVSRDAALRDAMRDAMRVAMSTGDSVDRRRDELALIDNGRGTPTVLARERGTAADPRLVLQSRVSETSERALALLLAASPARQQATVRSADVPVDAATLARWQRLPAGPAIGAGDAPPDVHTVSTDARWLWLAALVLLGVEWRVRRRARPTVSGDHAAATIAERA